MKKEEFLKHLNNESNHRVLLWPALEMSNGDVIEFGSGHGSTPFLQQYCKENAREFFTFENNPGWAEKTGSILIKHWDELVPRDCGVLFIDHAPGERRKIDISRWSNHAKIIVVHDTEKAADHGYKVRGVISGFKYKAEINTPGGGAGAAIMSNTIDVERFIGQNWKHFEIEAWKG